MATVKNVETIPLLGNGQSVRILNYIAEGGQGEVYKVAYNGGEYALKWYSKIVPTDAFYANLAHNIKVGAPEEYFLWPQAITEKVKGRFGAYHENEMIMGSHAAQNRGCTEDAGTFHPCG